ncbi:MAG: hypothetical protein IPG32_10770 [Saprospirales bacterium]|nr:hypothetical protein [Saprospirales bacterium]
MRMPSLVLALFLFLAVNGLYSQPAPIEQKVPATLEALRSAGEDFPRVDLFETALGDAGGNAKTMQVVSKGTLLELKAEAIEQLRQARHASMTLPLPSLESPGQEVELYRVDIFSPDFMLRYSSSLDKESSADRHLHYRGILKGNPNSLVAISILGTR